MNIFYIYIMAIGLSIDAFSVCFIKGMEQEKWKNKLNIFMSISMMTFQIIMFLIGSFIGEQLSTFISFYGKWLAFIFFISLGIKMICEKQNNLKDKNEGVLLLGLITSLDAIVIGFSLGITPEFNIETYVKILGITTFLFSQIGFYLGTKFGAKLNYKVNYIGGGIMIIMGLKSILI